MRLWRHRLPVRDAGEVPKRQLGTLGVGPRSSAPTSGTESLSATLLAAIRTKELETLLIGKKNVTKDPRTAIKGRQSQSLPTPISTGSQAEELRQKAVSLLRQLNRPYFGSTAKGLPLDAAKWTVFQRELASRGESQLIWDLHVALQRRLAMGWRTTPRSGEGVESSSGGTAASSLEGMHSVPTTRTESLLDFHLGSATALEAIGLWGAAARVAAQAMDSTQGASPFGSRARGGFDTASRQNQRELILLYNRCFSLAVKESGGDWENVLKSLESASSANLRQVALLDDEQAMRATDEEPERLDDSSLFDPSKVHGKLLALQNGYGRQWRSALMHLVSPLFGSWAFTDPASNSTPVPPVRPHVGGDSPARSRRSSLDPTPPPPTVESRSSVADECMPAAGLCERLPMAVESTLARFHDGVKADRILGQALPVSRTQPFTTAARVSTQATSEVVSLFRVAVQEADWKLALTMLAQSTEARKVLFQEHGWMSSFVDLFDRDSSAAPSPREGPMPTWRVAAALWTWNQARAGSAPIQPGDPFINLCCLRLLGHQARDSSSWTLALDLFQRSYSVPWSSTALSALKRMGFDSLVQQLEEERVPKSTGAEPTLPFPSDAAIQAMCRIVQQTPRNSIPWTLLFRLRFADTIDTIVDGAAWSGSSAAATVPRSEATNPSLILNDQKVKHILLRMDSLEDKVRLLAGIVRQIQLVGKGKGKAKGEGDINALKASNGDNDEAADSPSTLTVRGFEESFTIILKPMVDRLMERKDTVTTGPSADALNLRATPNHDPAYGFLHNSLMDLLGKLDLSPFQSNELSWLMQYLSRHETCWAMALKVVTSYWKAGVSVPDPTMKSALLGCNVRKQWIDGLQLLLRHELDLRRRQTSSQPSASAREGHSIPPKFDPLRKRTHPLGGGPNEVVGVTNLQVIDQGLKLIAMPPKGGPAWGWWLALTLLQRVLHADPSNAVGSTSRGQRGGPDPNDIAPSTTRDIQEAAVQVMLVLARTRSLSQEKRKEAAAGVWCAVTASGCPPPASLLAHAIDAGILDREVKEERPDGLSQQHAVLSAALRSAEQQQLLETEGDFPDTSETWTPSQGGNESAKRKENDMRLFPTFLLRARRLSGSKRLGAAFARQMLKVHDGERFSADMFLADRRAFYGGPYKVTMRSRLVESTVKLLGSVLLQPIRPPANRVSTSGDDVTTLSNKGLLPTHGCAGWEQALSLTVELSQQISRQVQGKNTSSTAFNHTDDPFSPAEVETFLELLHCTLFHVALQSSEVMLRHTLHWFSTKPVLHRFQPLNVGEPSRLNPPPIDWVKERATWNTLTSPRSREDRVKAVNLAFTQFIKMKEEWEEGEPEDSVVGQDSASLPQPLPEDPYGQFVRVFHHDSSVGSEFEHPPQSTSYALVDSMSSIRHFVDGTHRSRR
jgi:hypothetical protein